MGMGGAERLVYNLCSKLDRNLFQPSIAWFYGEKVLKEFADLGIPLHFIPKRKRFDPATILRFSRLIKDQRIDVVNAHHFLSLVYLFPGSKIHNSTKLIYTEHSSWELDRLPKRWRFVGKQMIRKLDYFVGVSDGVAGTAKKIFRGDPGKYITIENGVDLRLFGEAGSPGNIREQIGIEPGDVVIGNVANFRKVKNQMHLLEAFRALSETHHNIKLLFVGKGFEGDPENTEDDIRRYISEHRLGKKVILLGYRPDIPALLKCMDIFCLTSRMEGLPICLIEAMAAGLPIVGTDIEGIRGIVLSDVNGLLVPPGDVGELERRLKQLAEEPALRWRLGLAGNEMAESRFSLETCVSSYQKLFSNPRDSAN